MSKDSRGQFPYSRCCSEPSLGAGYNRTWLLCDQPLRQVPWYLPALCVCSLQSLESNPQLSFATRMEDCTCLGQHKRHPEFPVVTRESHRNSRKSTWFPRHRKMNILLFPLFNSSFISTTSIFGSGFLLALFFISIRLYSPFLAL